MNGYDVNMDMQQHREHVERIALQRSQHQHAVDALTNDLHDAIREALQAGVGVTDLANLTGLTRPRIYQIRDRRR